MQMLLFWSKRHVHCLGFSYGEVPDIPTASPVNNPCESVHRLNIRNDLHTLFTCDIALRQPRTYSNEIWIVAENGLTSCSGRRLFEGIIRPNRPF